MLLFRQFLEDIWGKQAVENFLPFIMASNSEETQKRIVHFLNRRMGTRADWEMLTADNFTAEGIPKSTIYNIIEEYLARGSVECQISSGRLAQKMNTLNKQRLKGMMDHKTVLSQRAPASTLFCDQSYIYRLTKKMKITY